MRTHYIIAFLLILASCHPKLSITEVGEWSIEAGQLAANGTAGDAMAEQYWDYVNALLPSDSLSQHIAFFVLYTDGPEEDLAGMSQFNHMYWKLELDTADINLNHTDSAYVLEYHHTLIHEFGHLLTLNHHQITPTNDEYQDDSKGYLTSEGYAKADSYLAQFINRFWPDSLLYEWDRADEVKAEKKRLKKLFAYYLKYADRFPNSYAAESPEEDIAEAWTFFVLSNKPTANDVMRQKVEFFYSYPELAALREDIRKNMPFIPRDYLERFERY